MRSRSSLRQTISEAIGHRRQRPDLRVLSPVAQPVVTGPGDRPLTVLVAVASAQGATREIADAITGTLRASGVTATTLDIDMDPDPAAYDAVVLGSAIHMHHWLPAAQRFAARHAAALRERPVWLFSSGMVAADSGKPWETGYPQGIEALIDATGARQHRVFTGRRALPRPAALWRLFGRGFVWYAVLRGFAPKGYHMAYGDYRDWEAIGAWAREIAAALRVQATRPAA